MSVTSAQYELIENWARSPDGLVHRKGADVAIDRQDRVYLLSRDESRVTVYDSDGSYLSSWTHELLGPGAHGISVDQHSNVFVVDWLEHCVCKFTAQGELQTILGVPGSPADTGSESWPPKELAYPVERLSNLRAAGPFNGPTKIAIGTSGDMYVSDGYGNARVHHFGPTGQLLSSWGAVGMGEGQFHNPHSIHIGLDELLYVSDRENDRIQVFTLEFEFIRAFEIQRPVAAAVDDDGRIAVASLRYEPGEDTFTRGRVLHFIPDRLSVLDQAGAVLFRVDGVIQVPNGIAVDSRGDIYVAQVGQVDALNKNLVQRGTRDHADAREHMSRDCAVPPLYKFRRRR